MTTIVRMLRRGLVMASVALAAALAVEPAQAQVSAGCSAANITGVLPSGPGGSAATPPGAFLQGQVINVTISGGGGNYRVTSPNGASVLLQPGDRTASVSFVITAPVTGSVTLAVVGAGDFDASFTVSCGLQHAGVNALVAAANGLYVLRHSNDAIKLAVISSFTGTGHPPGGEAQRAAAMRVGELEREEAALKAELADGAVERDETQARLLLAQRNLALARADAAALAGQRPAQPAPSGDAVRGTIDACGGESCAVRSWNGWFDSRGISTNDWTSQQNALGLVALAGADYKVAPWLALGLSVGFETFNTYLGGPGLRISTAGATLQPYAGVRLDPNIFLSTFVGVTRLNYRTEPVFGAFAEFDAWRVMAGVAVAGVWHEGGWRLQPSVDFTWASERQSAYVDRFGTSVAAQTVNYGRLSAGPEIGYRFDFGDFSLEPFVLVRGNLDFTPSSAVLISPQNGGLYGGGSASAGLGLVLRAGGMTLRADSAYESLGVRGIDQWYVRIRGGWSF